MQVSRSNGYASSTETIGSTASKQTAAGRWQAYMGVVDSDPGADRRDFSVDRARERNERRRTSRLGRKPKQNTIRAHPLGSCAQIHASVKFTRARDKVFGALTVRSIGFGAAQPLSDRLKRSGECCLGVAFHTPIIAGNESARERNGRKNDGAEVNLWRIYRHIAKHYEIQTQSAVSSIERKNLRPEFAPAWRGLERAAALRRRPEPSPRTVRP
jgi:hypothetical protein